MGMTLNEIKTKIGRRVGDPRLETYSDVVQDYFEQAFAMLLKKMDDTGRLIYVGEVTPSIASYDNHASGNSNYVSEVQINRRNFPDSMHIFSVASPVTAFKAFKQVSVDVLDEIAINDSVRPPSNEGYWTKDGDVIRIFLNTSQEYSVKIRYIKNPVPETWTADLVSSIGYGYGFISDCISLAADLLKVQQRLEG